MVKGKQYINRNRFWAGTLLAQFLLFFMLSKMSAAIKLFSDFFSWQKNVHIRLFSFFPFSVGDVFYILLVVFIIVLLAKAIITKKFKKNLLVFMVALNIICFFYQVFWGMLYHVTPLKNHFKNEKIRSYEIEKIAEKYLEKCIEDRKHIQEDANGVFRISDWEKIEDELLKNQRKIPKKFFNSTEIRHLSLKKSLFRNILSETGILGYYNPFTAETQYNPQLPDRLQPFTVAHEMSHQLGFAREQEASFIGYLMGVNSENPDLKYCTDYYVLKSVLNYLKKTNPKFVEQTINKFSKGMQRDRHFEIQFYEQHSGIMDAIFGISNDLFLKSNQQEGSVTYSYFVDLLISYERKSL